MTDFTNSILGTYSIGQVFSFCFFFLIGFIIYQMQEVNQRNVKSKRTPKKFSWKFLIKDNAKRFVLSALLIYIQFRFYYELTGQELTEFTALLVGYMGNGLADFGKRNIRTLQNKRDEMLNKE